MAKRTNAPRSIHSVHSELIPFLRERNIQALHASSLQRFFVKNPTKSLDDFAAKVPNLPEKLRGALEGEFVPFTTTIDTKQQSSDGSTTKLGIKLQDGQMVETVIMRYNKGEENRGRPRVSVCISSQIGCKMGCTFCATGTMGLKGHLTSGEIVEQLVHALSIAGSIDNVVFMGMGEPLDNYDAVLDAIKVITDGPGIGLAASKICVSTVGLIPRMKQLINDAPDVKIALSLHAPTQDLRIQIVPTAKAYNLDRLMEVIVSKDYKVKTTVRRTMGDDIDGACGQLVVKKGDAAVKEKDLEDMFADETSGLKKRKGGPTVVKAGSKLTEVKNMKVTEEKPSKKELDDKKQLEDEAEEGLNELRSDVDWFKSLFPFLTLIFFAVLALAIGLMVLQFKEPEEPAYRSPFMDKLTALPRPKHP
ncbi:hypothetical protein BC829DRAFT_394058 [Chytridium lagenaria]|nr:hypothetical protein BC829DRAFT_394058 [Chytridium lagenaria]